TRGAGDRPSSPAAAAGAAPPPGTALPAPSARAAEPSGPPDLARLTPAERRVLALIADFKTSKEIADALGIHYRTVDNHRTNIAGKLGLTGSHALTRFAALHRNRLK